MTENTPNRVGSQEQFGRQARFYAESLVHSSGESLQVVTEWVSRGRYERAVDIGTGTGFTAFAVAPYVGHILATDITSAMLGEARRLADQRGVGNLGCTLAAAEDLPFADGSLDLVTCRTAAHHFRDLPRAVAQWPMVLAPGGVLIMADTTAPEDPETALWMKGIEARRDPSHVRDLPPSEWLALLEANGFSITDTALAPVPLEFDDWVRRSGTPEAEVQRLRRDFESAPGGAIDAFQIRQDESGSVLFQWECLVVRALRQG